ncbi:MAG: hypothetical protein M1829_001825 [Trizodia sp. TS-e1964]|nr:MAG: hypothetical protein M1829_001825 [Trizodia sp. TS-e1964]
MQWSRLLLLLTLATPIFAAPTRAKGRVGSRDGSFYGKSESAVALEAALSKLGSATKALVQDETKYPHPEVYSFKWKPSPHNFKLTAPKEESDKVWVKAGEAYAGRDENPSDRRLFVLEFLLNKAVRKTSAYETGLTSSKHLLEAFQSNPARKAEFEEKVRSAQAMLDE